MIDMEGMEELKSSLESLHMDNPVNGKRNSFSVGWKRSQSFSSSLQPLSTNSGIFRVDSPVEFASSLDPSNPLLSRRNSLSASPSHPMWGDSSVEVVALSVHELEMSLLRTQIEELQERSQKLEEEAKGLKRDKENLQKDLHNYDRYSGSSSSASTVTGASHTAQTHGGDHKNMSNPYEIPLETQRRVIKVDSQLHYIQFFPLELTLKDYYRRVFDILYLSALPRLMEAFSWHNQQQNSSKILDNFSMMVSHTLDSTANGSRSNGTPSTTINESSLPRDFNQLIDFLLARDVAKSSQVSVSQRTRAMMLSVTHPSSFFLICEALERHFHGYNAQWVDSSQLNKMSFVLSQARDFLQAFLSSSSNEASQNTSDPSETTAYLETTFSESSFYLGLANLRELEDMLIMHGAFKEHRMNLMNWKWTGNDLKVQSYYQSLSSFDASSFNSTTTSILNNAMIWNGGSGSDLFSGRVSGTMASATSGSAAATPGGLANSHNSNRAWEMTKEFHSILPPTSTSAKANAVNLGSKINSSPSKISSSSNRSFTPSQSWGFHEGVESNGINSTSNKLHVSTRLSDGFERPRSGVDILEAMSAETFNSSLRQHLQKMSINLHPSGGSQVSEFWQSLTGLRARCQAALVPSKMILAVLANRVKGFSVAADWLRTIAVDGNEAGRLHSFSQGLLASYLTLDELDASEFAESGMKDIEEELKSDLKRLRNENAQSSSRTARWEKLLLSVSEALSKLRDMKSAAVSQQHFEEEQEIEAVLQEIVKYQGTLQELLRPFHVFFGETEVDFLSQGSQFFTCEFCFHWTRSNSNNSSNKNSSNSNASISHRATNPSGSLNQSWMTLSSVTPLLCTSIGSLCVRLQSKAPLQMFVEHWPSFALPVPPSSSSASGGHGPPSQSIISQLAHPFGSWKTQSITIDHVRKLKMTDPTSLRRFGFTVFEIFASEIFPVSKILSCRFPLSEFQFAAAGKIGNSNGTLQITSPFAMTPESASMMPLIRAEDLYQAGYSVEDCRVLGMDPSQLLRAGYSPRQVIEEGGFSMASLKMAGLDIARHVLMRLFEMTDGKHWKKRTNWGSQRPLNEWYGIQVNGAGQVVRIDLRSNYLRGKSFLLRERI